MVFEWVDDYDPFPSKKKRWSDGYQMQGSTSAKKSATVEVPNFDSIEDLELNYTYLAYLNMKGYLGGSNLIAGGLRYDDNGMEQSDGGESIDKSASANVGVEDENNGVDLDDPQYKLFLENLRGDGNGFFVKVEAHTGLKEPLRYETEKMKIKTEKIKRRVELPTEWENGAMVEILDMEDDGKSNNISRKRNRRENNKAKCMKNISGESKMVMNPCAVIEGTSEESCEEVEANNQTELNHEKVTCRRTKTKAEKRVEAPIEKETRVLEDDPKGKSNNASWTSKKAHLKREKVRAKCLKNVSRESKRVASSSRMGEGSSKRLNRVVPWDDSYLAFLLCFRGDEDRCIYTNLDGKQVKYNEEEDEYVESSSSDVEILSPKDLSGFETNMGFVVSKPSIVIDADADCPEEMTPPDLRVKMIAELKRPYDATEYANLLKEVNLRKYQEKCRQLRRSRDVAYQTDATCKSYLEMHPALERKMKLARGNPPAILNLLRGFFFWLKYVPYNMFQPWTDPQCLSILPETTMDDAPSLAPPYGSTAIVPIEL